MKRSTRLGQLICVAVLAACANGLAWYELVVLPSHRSVEHFERVDANIEHLKAEGYEFVPILQVPALSLDDCWC